MGGMVAQMRKGSDVEAAVNDGGAAPSASQGIAEIYKMSNCVPKAGSISGPENSMKFLPEPAPATTLGCTTYPQKLKKNIRNVVPKLDQFLVSKIGSDSGLYFVFTNSGPESDPNNWARIRDKNKPRF
jgi:hypothetical protein